MKSKRNLLVLTVVLIVGSCDDKPAEVEDASVSESCAVYVNPGNLSDAGDGNASTEEFQSLDAALQKALSLTPSCGDETEIRLAEGFLSDDRIGILREGLKASKIRVGTYALNSASAAAESQMTESISGALYHASRDNISKLSALTPNNSVDTFGDDTLTPRSSGSSTDYFVVTGKAPYYKLDNKDDGYVDWVFEANVGNLFLRRSTATGSGQKGERIVLRSSSAPKSAVEISGYENGGSGDGNGILRLYKDTDTSAPMIMDNNEIDSYDSNGLFLNNNSDQSIFIAANTKKSNYIYMARGSGNVGIGNLSKNKITHKLTVDGGIKAEELVLDNVVGADFVFEDDYALMDLEDVATFVEENKHLPDIASADEMQQRGLATGKFQIKLLQKIEELTLYAIEQNNRIKTLEESCVW